MHNWTELASDCDISHAAYHGSPLDAMDLKFWFQNVLQTYSDSLVCFHLSNLYTWEGLLSCAGQDVESCLTCNFYGFAGERTFGVLTKLDLMDKGTNALDVSASSL